jgi:N-carbamoylputrescine amidase
MSTIRLALAQALARFGARESENLGNALDCIQRAAQEGADLVAFAENFPGPFTESNRYDVHQKMAAAACEYRVAVAYGTSLPATQCSGGYNIATVVLDAEGEHRGTYRRTHPVGPYIYRDSSEWNFDYVAADAFPVIKMPWGTLGISVCSEVHLPEVSRILALRGAEVILYPSGLLIHELGYTETWQTLVYARAIENHAYTATLVNLMDRSVGEQFQSGEETSPEGRGGTTRGIGMIASPEGILARSGEPGLLIADLDLDRVRFLRATAEELIVPAPYRTIPGHLSWRRPELYSELIRPTTDNGTGRSRSGKAV